MSFSNQANVSGSLVMRIWLLIIYIKASAINSCRHHDDSENEERELKEYKYQQINHSKDVKRQDLPADYIHFSLLLKDIESSDKPRWGDKKPDPPDKYTIKELPDKLPIWLLRVCSQKEYKGQKRSDTFQLPRNTVIIWKVFWLRQKVRPLLPVPSSTIVTVSERGWKP